MNSMNFQELCEFVAEEVNGRPVTFTSVVVSGLTDPFERRVIRAVQRAYTSIMHHSRYWGFLNFRGTIKELSQGVDRFSLPSTLTIDPEGLYVAQGTTSRWPICVESYAWWKREEQFGTTSQGVPQYLLPADEPEEWVVWPIPDGSYDLIGNARWNPEPLVEATDEPIWDANYHEMLAWLAIRQLEGRVKTQDERVSATNVKEATDQFNTQWEAFCAEYLLPPYKFAASTFV